MFLFCIGVSVVATIITMVIGWEYLRMDTPSDKVVAFLFGSVGFIWVLLLSLVMESFTSWTDRTFT